MFYTNNQIHGRFCDFLVRQHELHNQCKCKCIFSMWTWFWPFCFQPSGMPHGPSCCWQCWAVLLAWCLDWALSLTAPRTGECAQVALPWSCQVNQEWADQKIQISIQFYLHSIITPTVTWPVGGDRGQPDASPLSWVLFLELFPSCKRFQKQLYIQVLNAN